MNIYSLAVKHQIYTLYLKYQSVRKAREEYIRIRQLRDGGNAPVPSRSTIRRFITEIGKSTELKASNAPVVSGNTGNTKKERMVAEYQKEAVVYQKEAKPSSRESAYGLFLAVCIETHKTQFPEKKLKHMDMKRRCAEEWKKLDSKYKKHFETKAIAENSRFEAETKQYIANCKSSKRRAVKPCAGQSLTDRDRPKKPMQAYIFFCRFERTKVREKMENRNPRNVTSQLGKMWKKLSKDQKTIYEAMAAKDKVRYSREMAEYCNRNHQLSSKGG